MEDKEKTLEELRKEAKEDMQKAKTFLQMEKEKLRKEKKLNLIGWIVFAIVMYLIFFGGHKANAWYLPTKNNTEATFSLMKSFDEANRDGKKSWKFSSNFLQAQFTKDLDFISNLQIENQRSRIGNTLAYPLLEGEGYKIKLLGGAATDFDFHVKPAGGFQFETDSFIAFWKNTDGHEYRAGFKYYFQKQVFHLGVVAEGSERTEFLCAGIVFGFRLSREGFERIEKEMNIPPKEGVDPRTVAWR